VFACADSPPFLHPQCLASFSVDRYVNQPFDALLHKIHAAWSATRMFMPMYSSSRASWIRATGPEMDHKRSVQRNCALIRAFKTIYNWLSTC
jgi:hypothetical protein